MYDFYPDDWGGPEPFEPLLDAPDDVGVSPTPAALPQEPSAARLPVLTEDEILAFLIRVATDAHYPEETRHSAHTLLKRRTPSVKALSHRETLGEIALSPNVSAKTRLTARHILRLNAKLHLNNQVRTEDLRGL